MSEDLRTQIYNNLNLRETDELIDIWRRRDQAEWTDMALEVVQGILLMRLGALPTDDEFIEAENKTNLEDEVTLDNETQVLEDEYSTEFVEEDSGQAPLPEPVCPNCKGSHTHVRHLGIYNSMTKIGLKKPMEGMVEKLLGIEEYEEIVGVVCYDCGFVFFMLKDFVRS